MQPYFHTDPAPGCTESAQLDERTIFAHHLGAFCFLDTRRPSDHAPVPACLAEHGITQSREEPNLTSGAIYQRIETVALLYGNINGGWDELAPSQPYNLTPGG